MTRREFMRLAGAAAPIMALAACATAPFSQRSQFIIVSRAQELNLGREASREILAKEPTSADPRYTGPVLRSGERVALAARDSGYADSDNFRWEFHVIDKPDTINAFALPGGQVFVYTGLFKLAATEAEMATVIGHEAGHIIARHGAERMSMSLVANLGEQLVGTALSLGGVPGAGAFQVAYGIGANVGVILPFSRTQEYEADRIGLILMAMAGYDPHTALDFWAKMAAKSGDKPPEYLSTHPSDEKRIQAIEELMPQAMDYYRPRAGEG